MFIVPLSGDQIETVGGVKHAVLGYASYNDEPAVYVDDAGAKATHIPFSDITKINNTPVKLTKGKVFETTGKFNRKVQLPQRDDRVQADQGQFKVESLKLGERGKLTAGMLVSGVDDEKNKLTARLSDVVRIQRADEESAVTARFERVYADYLGTNK